MTRARRTLAVAALVAVAAAACGAAEPTAAGPDRAGGDPGAGDATTTAGPLDDGEVDDGEVLRAEEGARGDFLVTCAPSHRGPDDPLVHHGHAGASHLHDFFGNTATDADTVPADLLVDGDTTCDRPLDRSAYWVPTLFHAGEPVEPSRADAYYVSPLGADVRALIPPPEGLMMIGGDPTGVDTARAERAGWACGNSKAIRPDPPTCEAGVDLAMHVRFPDCWNGTDLDSHDHRAHVEFSMAGVCPLTHPVPMVQLQLVVRYAPEVTEGLDLGALTLSSGDLATAHGDFVNGWDQTALARETQVCVNRRVICAVY